MCGWVVSALAYGGGGWALRGWFSVVRLRMGVAFPLGVRVSVPVCDRPPRVACRLKCWLREDGDALEPVLGELRGVCGLRPRRFAPVIGTVDLLRARRVLAFVPALVLPQDWGTTTGGTCSVSRGVVRTARRDLVPHASFGIAPKLGSSIARRESLTESPSDDRDERRRDIVYHNPTKTPSNRACTSRL